MLNKGGEKVAAKRGRLASLLSDYSKSFDIFISILLIVLGFYIYFVGFENVKIVTTIVSVILVLYGAKRILDVVIRTLMGKELEQLLAEEKESAR